MTGSQRIALVEDNTALREEITFLLQNEGLDIAEFGTAADFLQAHGETPFTLLLLDLGLPDQDGIEVAKRLSCNRDDIGIIMLTARDSLNDRIKGLQTGADAYLSKPFELGELLAHINALVRRKNYYTEKTCWQFALSAQQLLAPDGKTVLELTSAESCIMKLLVQYYPEYVSRADLVAGLGEDYRVYDDRRLEQIMSRLRKKIRQSHDTTPIKAVRGRGYLFIEPVELAD